VPQSRCSLTRGYAGQLANHLVLGFSPSMNEVK
jgi:hypothetical protein